MYSYFLFFFLSKNGIEKLMGIEIYNIWNTIFITIYLWKQRINVQKRDNKVLRKVRYYRHF